MMGPEDYRVCWAETRTTGAVVKRGQVRTLNSARRVAANAFAGRVKHFWIECISDPNRKVPVEAAG